MVAHTRDSRESSDHASEIEIAGRVGVHAAGRVLVILARR